MFQALLCSSSGGKNCIIQHLASSHSVGDRSVRWCTWRPPTECDGTSKQTTDDSARSLLRAGQLRLQTYTQNMKYLLLFHGKHFYANAPHYDVIRTLHLLLSSDFPQNYNRWKIFCVTYFCACCMCTASLGQRTSRTPNSYWSRIVLNRPCLESIINSQNYISQAALKIIERL